MQNPKNLLNIQKLIFLLSDFHCNHFYTFLEESNAALPLQLCHSIKSRLPDFHSAEQLTESIYGNSSEQNKLKFNQLTTYTFKLSYHLALHYPNYLAHNVSTCQELINNGQVEKAEFVAEVTLDVANKIGDYTTQISILEIQLQLSSIFKSTKEIDKTVVYLNQALQHKLLLTELITQNAQYNTLSTEEKTDLIKKTQSLLDHPEKPIMLVASYIWLRNKYKDNTIDFYNSENQKILVNTIREFNNSSFIVLPYLFDLKSKLFFIKLNTSFINLDKSEDKKELQAHHKHFKQIAYWDYLQNGAELSHTIVKTNFYMVKFIHLGYRHDFYQYFTPKSLQEVEELIDTCLTLKLKYKNNKRFIPDLIRINIVLSTLQLITGPKLQLDKGLLNLEDILFTYQQVNFSGSTNTIFMLLMQGYFAKKDFEQCVKTYLRYNKNIKGKPTYKGNEFVINRYYYLAKWHINPKPIYLNSIDDIVESFKDTNSYNKVCNIWNEIIDYFNLPIERKTTIDIE